MLAWFLTHTETVFKAIVGLVAVVIGLVYRKNLIDSGYEKKENEITKANLNAVKSGKEIEKTIESLSDDELDDRMRQRLHKNKTK